MTRGRGRLSDLLSALGGAGATVVGWIVTAAAWAHRQTGAALRNFRALLSDDAFYRENGRNWIAFMLAPIRFYGRQLKRAFLGSPQEQMWGSFVLFVTVLIVTLGVAAPLAIVFVLTFLVGSARLFPVADDAYARAIRDPASGAGDRRWIRKRSD